MSVEFKQFTVEKYGKSVASLWNEVVKERDFYKQFTEEGFFNILFRNPHFKEKGAFVALDHDEVVGFACGMIRNEDFANETAPGYFNTIIVKKEYRRQGIGKKLLLMVEEYFKEEKRQAVRCVFFSPVNWPWYVPNTDHHDHPGNPAIPVNSPEYFFLLHNGYYVQGFQDAFHLDLKDYEMSEEVKNKMKENEKRGYKIEVYDPKRHYGIDEFCVKINAEGFARAIKSNLAKPVPNPFLVVSENGKVVGWTGAMYTEPSGRAHFDGITVSPDVRGGGLGKTLFCSLGQYSKEHGSSFMTFFTGLDNPARYIYLYAGYKIIQTFAVMKKELK